MSPNNSDASSPVSFSIRGHNCGLGGQFCTGPMTRALGPHDRSRFTGTFIRPNALLWLNSIHDISPLLMGHHG